MKTPKKALQKTTSDTVERIIAFTSMDATDVEAVEFLMIMMATIMCTFGDDDRLLRVGLNHRNSYVEEQKTVLGWLSKFSKWESLRIADRNAVLNQIKPWIEKAESRAQVHVANGKFIHSQSRNFEDVQAILGIALSRLFEPEVYGLEPLDIGQCPECQNFFLKGRSDQITCSAICRVHRCRPPRKQS